MDTQLVVICTLTFGINLIGTLAYAARIAGVGRFAIMIGHVLPGLRASLLVIFALHFATLLIAESGLSFLGIGIRPPTSTWGVMINEGFLVFSATPWAVLLPAMCISIVLLAFTFVGDGLRDALDPRMKI